jgi:aromatic ring-opening dioxygenase catalytic subunit (LigB family)
MDAHLAQHAVPETGTMVPSSRHLMPIFVVLGAAEPAVPAERIHHSFTFSTISMAAYAFP